MRQKRIPEQVGARVVHKRLRIADVGYIARNAQVEGLARAELHDAVHLPVAEYPAHRTCLAEVSLSLAKWKSPNSAHREEWRDIVGGHAAAAVGIIVILKRGKAAGSILHIEPPARTCVDGLGPGIRDQVLEAIAEPAVQLDLQCVVIALAAIRTKHWCRGVPGKRPPGVDLLWCARPCSLRCV